MSHAVLERLIRAIEEKDIEAFGGLYAVSAVMHEPMLAEPANGRAQIVEGEASLMAAFSDIEVRVRGVASSEHRVIAEVVMTAVNDGPLDVGEGEVQPTQRRIEVPMVWALDLDPGSGQIIEERDYFDTALIMRQLNL